MNKYCSLCGNHHQESTGGCLMSSMEGLKPTNQVYKAGEFVGEGSPTLEAEVARLASETEVCPTCSGSGKIPVVLSATMKRMAGIFNKKSAFLTNVDLDKYNS